MKGIIERPVIAVLMGGTGAKHTESLRSGVSAMALIQEAYLDYDVIPITIDLRGYWHVGGLWRENGFVYSPFHYMCEILEQLKSINVRCIFNALCGGWGVDGHVQGMLDAAGIPYTGPGLQACVLTADKTVVKNMSLLYGSQVLPSVTFTMGAWEKKQEDVVAAVNNVGFPLVLGSVYKGDLDGRVYIKDSKVFVRHATSLMRGFGEEKQLGLIAEKFIEGTGIKVGTIWCGQNDPLMLPLSWGVKKNSAREKTNKKQPTVTCKGIEDVLSPGQQEQMNSTSQTLHVGLNCRGVSVSSFIAEKDTENTYFLGIDPLPRLYSEGAVACMVAEAKELKMKDLIKMMIEHADMDDRATTNEDDAMKKDVDHGEP